MLVLQLQLFDVQRNRVMRCLAKQADRREGPMRGLGRPRFATISALEDIDLATGPR